MEYRLGKDEVPVDVVRVRRAREDVTRPVEADALASEWGPSYADLDRLDTGELAALSLSGRYRIERRLGKGGMASVFLGEHLSLGRPVAIKVLADRHAERPEALARFLREARLTARIRHPNVVEVFDFGTTPQGLVYLVMELLRGEDLRATIARRRGLPWDRVRPMMLQICAGLRAAHALGVVHRDLKPANCFRVLAGEREQIKLVDFGIAAVHGSEGLVLDHCELPREVEAISRRRRLTRAGTVVGTPEYMSPEQARGENVDARSDVYSAGIILAELLTGHVPFEGDSVTAVLTAQIYDRAPTLAELAAHDLDPRLDRIYRKAVAKRPGDRFQDMGEFAAALREIPARPSAPSGSFVRAVAQMKLPETVSTQITSSDDAVVVDPSRDGKSRARPGWLSRQWRLVAAASVLALLGGLGWWATGVTDMGSKDSSGAHALAEEAAVLQAHIVETVETPMSASMVARVGRAQLVDSPDDVMPVINEGVDASAEAPDPTSSTPTRAPRDTSKLQAAPVEAAPPVASTSPRSERAQAKPVEQASSAPSLAPRRDKLELDPDAPLGSTPTSPTGTAPPAPASDPPSVPLDTSKGDGKVEGSTTPPSPDTELVPESDSLAPMEHDT